MRRGLDIGRFGSAQSQPGQKLGLLGGKLLLGENTLPMQVREPLYRSSVGGWRRYAKYLRPLADALGQDVPDRLAGAMAES